MNKYKISLRVKKPIPKSYFTTILANYEHYFNTASNCSILLDNDITIHYLDIYLNDLIDIETFIEICLILSFIKFNITDNIKMKDIDIALSCELNSLLGRKAEANNVIDEKNIILTKLKS